MIYKFYSQKCLPCKQLTAFLEHNQIEVVSIDVASDENASLIEKFGIMSVPALVDVETGVKIVGFDVNGVKALCGLQ